MRDPDRTARTLERWLGGQLGADHVTVSDLTIPKAGFSNETIVGRAGWSDSAGDHAREFVLRIQPTAHQLFVEPDALRQARVMAALEGVVPVPRIWLTEADHEVLGAPFFLMERVHGRVPGDVPSWHHRGWTTELDPDRQRVLHDNALRELVHLHAADTREPELEFLETDGSGTALQRYVEHLARWFEWCRPVLRYEHDAIERAMQHVRDEIPDDDRRSVVWGDARVGNMMFADELTVAAMLDWEGATLGPPEIDVTWWVMFDEFLCEAQGLTRLPGIPERRGTLARYEELADNELRDVGYYSVLAGLQLALINSRLADLLISGGKVSETVGREFVTRVIGLMNRSLEHPDE